MPAKKALGPPRFSWAADKLRHPRPKVGDQYNAWAVIQETHDVLSGEAAWVCRCVCGTERVLRKHNLVYDHSKSCGCQQKREWEERWYLKVYNDYKTRTTGTREFALTPEDFKELIVQPCYYCGAPPSNIRKRPSKHKSHHTYNGLDRVDNKRGYTRDNVVPCCAKCNRAKRDLTQADFFDLVERIHQKHGQNSWAVG